jgi:anti-sigma-K factor RskA
MSNRTKFLNEDDNLLAAEYALGVLQGDARATFANRLAKEPSLVAAVRAWDEQFIVMVDDIAPVDPPRHIEQALDKRLFASAQPKASWWDNLRLWRGLAMASLAAVVAIGAWNLRPLPTVHADALMVQIAGDANAVTLLAYYDANAGELRLNRTKGEAATDRSFELWLIAGTDAPVSLGVLPSQTTGKFAIPENLRSKLKGGTLAISDEPFGGSPTNAPTGNVLATGTLSAV